MQSKIFGSNILNLFKTDSHISIFHSLIVQENFIHRWSRFLRWQELEKEQKEYLEEESIIKGQMYMETGLFLSPEKREDGISLLNVLQFSLIFINKFIIFKISVFRENINIKKACIYIYCFHAFISNKYFSVLPKKDKEDQTRKDSQIVPIEAQAFFTQMRYLDHSFDNLRRYKRYKKFQLLQYDQRYHFLLDSYR